MTSRSYVSPLREAEAAATRARIVDTAGDLFVRDGFAATSMKALAAAAGVSVQTVNLQGPKHALLIAAFERAFAGDEGRQPLAERPAMQAIIAEPDTAAALRAYAAFLADANARAAGLMRAMALAADADEGARTAYADLEERRRRDMLIGAGFFVQRGLLPPERAQWAADQLGVITGPDAFLHLVGSCGWTAEAYEEWVVQGLEQMVAAGGTA